MSGKSILFGQSYFLRFDPKLWAAMMPYPPLGTLYAASVMRERGYEVYLFDAMLAESERDWEAEIQRIHPAYAVLFEDNFNYLSKMCLLRMREAASSMIGMAKAHGCRVIVCGADASDHPELYLTRGADFVLIGEGEVTLVELLDFLENQNGETQTRILDSPILDSPILDSPTLDSPTLDSPILDSPILDSPILDSSILDSSLLPPGLAWLSADRSGQVERTPKRPEIKDLDRLPFPAWDLVDVENYRRIWIDRHGYFSMNMATTRGCPYHCNWCAKPIWGQRYNVRSPQNVVQELDWLRDHYRPDHIWFADDIFGLKPGWLQEFARLVRKSSTISPYKCLSRVDLLLRQGEVEALRDSGAEIVWVGAESGSQEILNSMEKGTQIDQIYAAARLVRKAGIRIGFFLQFGYPGEGLEDIEKTRRMVSEIMPDDIGISVSYPLPGTKFYAKVLDQLGEKKNWYDSNDLAMMYRGPFSSAFYRQLHKVVHKEFRLRRNWQDLTGGILMPETRRGGVFKKSAVTIYQAITLPFDRRELSRLENIPHQPILPLESGMSLEEAARPTPQG
ncbi:MAG TPA: radical SAM protein [Anaerolineales bacterium]|nr:radical SAM protein [Anaerolineales bacterium]